MFAVCVFALIGLVPMTPAEECTVQNVAGVDTSSSFGYYNTSPESPNGERIAYVCYKSGASVSGGFWPGELWVCDHDLANHRKVVDLAGFSPHNGAELCWIDNRRVALRDNVDTLRVIDVETGEDIIEPVHGLSGLGQNAWDGHVLYVNSYNRSQISGDPVGLYEVDTSDGATQMIFRPADHQQELEAQFPPELTSETLLPPSQWVVLHAQYSPDGTRIVFRLDVGTKWKARLLCFYDRSTETVSIFPIKPLHFLWYDNDSIVGHDVVGGGLLKRWNIHTGSSEVVGIAGNHLAVSPDGSHFASETDYHSDPVDLRYFSYGAGDDEVEIVASHNFPNVTWSGEFHANPSFSRDGHRLYFHMPVDENTNGIFCIDLEQ